MLVNVIIDHCVVDKEEKPNMKRKATGPKATPKAPKAVSIFSGKLKLQLPSCNSFW